jgi:NADH-quinone oxidoreductase subunit G
MSSNGVRLTIEGAEISSAPGTLLVDAAKRIGIDIPVFCYHPKLEPVGMCRMCLVEIGRPARDRATGQPVLTEQGEPVIQFGANLETACTTQVGEGWQVRVFSGKAIEGRKAIVEYLLTSHPLDCPICDKGGECPLQNLTMDHGPGLSRFLFDEKLHLAKHLPLGELIYLDRERCIQCARCTRFQEEVAGDPVISLSQRGRRLEIVTFSDPGFDSYFSGNSTDICPVGALTTADFRFGARPWELNAAASICPHCPVGCNLTLNTRRSAGGDGRETIKRVMPRQNELVNEIWICDKGRFVHHYAHGDDRLSRPLVRENGRLVETTWEVALNRAADLLSGLGAGLLGLAGGRLSNEDLFNFRALIEGLGGMPVLDDWMAGGDLVRQFGVYPGTNLGTLGQGDAVLVIATDLHEEAPIWWLRIKQAAERGVELIVANARWTRLDSYSAHLLRYAPGEAVQSGLGLLSALTGDPKLQSYVGDQQTTAAATALSAARNLIVVYGNEGLDYPGSEALARACARLLSAGNHLGRPNNGLIAVWPRANTQGAWDMGLRPLPAGLAGRLEQSAGAYIVAADPVGDDPAVGQLLSGLRGLVVQDLFLSPTAELADVVLPVQSFVEREGTFTSGERRVQRLYPAVPGPAESRADWKIVAELGRRLGLELEGRGAGQVFARIAAQIPDYSGLSYADLAASARQWPEVGGQDLYYGGTAYDNRQGLGVQLAPRPAGEPPEWLAAAERKPSGDLLLIPISRLYDRGATMLASELLSLRLAELKLAIHPEDAERLGLIGASRVELSWDGRASTVEFAIEQDVPRGAGLVARSTGLPLNRPTEVRVRPASS